MRLWLFIKENKLMSLVISTTVSFIIATPRLIKIYNRHVIVVHQEFVKDSLRAARTDSALYYFSIIRSDIATIKTSQEGQARDVSEIRSSQKKLKDYMLDKVATKDDAIKIMSIFDNEKKNETH